MKEIRSTEPSQSRSSLVLRENIESVGTFMTLNIPLNPKHICLNQIKAMKNNVQSQKFTLNKSNDALICFF